MDASTIRALTVIALLFAGTFVVSARTLTVSRNAETEQVSLTVPDSWAISQEEPGSDFIVHNQVAISPDGSQKIRLGWMVNTDVPMRISDEMVESFKSQTRDWLAAHQISGEITGTQDMNLEGHAARKIQLILDHDGKKSEVDYYMVLGLQAIYVISAYHSPDIAAEDLEASIQSVSIGQSSLASADHVSTTDSGASSSSDTQDPVPTYTSRPSSSYSSSSSDSSSSGGGTYFIPIGLIIKVILVACGIGGAAYRGMRR